MFFLTPASAITSIVLSSLSDIKYTLLSLLRWTLLAIGSEHLTVLKEKWSGKRSARHCPGFSSLFKVLKADKTLFRQWLISTMELFSWMFCLIVSWLVAMQWGGTTLECWRSSSMQVACWHGREVTHKLCQLASLLRCRLIGISPAMASMPQKGKVQNAPVIYSAALCCIFFRSLRGYWIGTPLKYHSWNP